MTPEEGQKRREQMREEDYSNVQPEARFKSRGVWLEWVINRRQRANFRLLAPMRSVGWPLAGARMRIFLRENVASIRYACVCFPRASLCVS